MLGLSSWLTSGPQVGLHLQGPFQKNKGPANKNIPFKLKRFLDVLRVRFQAFSVGELFLTRRGREFRAIPSSRRAVERTRETKQSNSSETMRKRPPRANKERPEYSHCVQRGARIRTHLFSALGKPCSTKSRSQIQSNTKKRPQSKQTVSSLVSLRAARRENPNAPSFSSEDALGAKLRYPWPLDIVFSDRAYSYLFTVFESHIVYARRLFFVFL